MTPQHAQSSNAITPWRGEEVDLDRFWADAWSELQKRQKRFAKTVRIKDAEWIVDQQQGLIRFLRADGVEYAAPVQIVGAWNPRTGRFIWGWDHPSVAPRLRQDAERTRWFGDYHGLPELTQASLNVTKDEAWRLASVAMKVNGADSVYCGASDGPIVFMTIGALRRRC